MGKAKMSNDSKYIHDLELQAAELFIEKTKTEEQLALAKIEIKQIKKQNERAVAKCEQYKQRKAIRYSEKLRKMFKKSK